MFQDPCRRVNQHPARLETSLKMWIVGQKQGKLKDKAKHQMEMVFIISPDEPQKNLTIKYVLMLQWHQLFM